MNLNPSKTWWRGDGTVHIGELRPFEGRRRYTRSSPFQCRWALLTNRIGDRLFPQLEPFRSWDPIRNWNQYERLGARGAP